jgi:hypothetical protein
MGTKLDNTTEPQHDAKLPVTTSASPKLKHLIVIGKFDDGKCRQVLINPKTQDLILSAILACEGNIRALETTLDGIDIELPS